MATSQYDSPALISWSSAPSHIDDLPLTERFNGAVLIVDISGFTKLTEKLSSVGKPGAEQINNVLTRFFLDISAVLDRHGGTILDYEGDSVVVGWRNEAGTASGTPLHRCCTCALDIRGDFSPRTVDGHLVDVRISVGQGDLDLIHLGFEKDRRYLITSGQAIDEAARLSAQSRPGDVLISANTAAQIDGLFSCEPQPNGSFKLTAARASASGFHEEQTKFAPKSSNAFKDAGDYLLPVARARMDASLANWMGEIRTLTLLFLEIALEQDAGQLQAVNTTAVETVQVLEKLGGSILSIRLRNEALLIETAFGLPGEAQGHDDWRVIATAMEVQSLAQNGNFGVSSGIATGPVFCGPYGAPHFRKYSTIGSAANRAARLRDAAERRILVDEETREICKRSIGFEGPHTFQLSGIGAEVKAFVPTEQKLRHPQQVPVNIIGRDKESRTLREMLDDCRDRVQVAVIHGDGGIGKSTLVEYLVSEFADGDVSTAIGMADALDRQTPYLAWRGVLRQCLGLSRSGSQEETKASDVQTKLKEAVGDTTSAPLINDVIDLNLPESRVTASMPSNVRAENLRRLLLDLIVHHLNTTTRVVVIEDAHWLDNVSRDLLLDVVRAAPRALILVTSRRGETLEADLADLEATGCSLRYIPLEPLVEKNVIEVAQRVLGEERISESLRNFIVQTSDGVPLFVEELCHLARNRGESEFNALTKLPNLLEATILGRIDTLSPEEQIVLKSASVFGRRFSKSMISQLNQLTDRQIDIEAALTRITDLRLFRLNQNQPNELEFRHQIIRDLVYDGMLSDQKSETHAAVAREMEAQATAEDIETLPLLLTHWRRAGHPAKIATYLERLAALRLRQFDNAAAISLLEEYFDQIKQPAVPVDAMRNAQCYIMLGKAHSGLGKMVEAESAFRDGLQGLGMRVPSGRRSLALALARQMLQQMRMRRTLDSIRAQGAVAAKRSLDKEQQKAELAAEAHEALMQIYYFNGQKPRLLHSALSASNLSASLGVATPSLAVNTAGVGAICGVIPLRKQAAYYLERASQVAEIVDMPSVSSRVGLYSGLYQTAVADFDNAQENFLKGMESADAIGDRRLWCEHAVSLELITSPWSFTSAFRSVDAWDDLLDWLENISVERDDVQVLACALLGRFRGNRAIGRAEANLGILKRLEQLLDPNSPKLEQIHYTEGAGLLAATAFEMGDRVKGDAWMAVARERMDELEPGMKSRTLPALVAVFDACLRQHDQGTQQQQDTALQLASVVVAKLRVFARIYPIGQPHLMLYKGDLSALNGKAETAARLWRDGLVEAKRLRIHAAAAVLTQRLKFLAIDTKGELSPDAAVLRQLDADVAAHRDIFDKTLNQPANDPSGVTTEISSKAFKLRKH